MTSSWHQRTINKFAYNQYDNYMITCMDGIQKMGSSHQTFNFPNYLQSLTPVAFVQPSTQYFHLNVSSSFSKINHHLQKRQFHSLSISSKNPRCIPRLLSLTYPRSIPRSTSALSLTYTRNSTVYQPYFHLYNMYQPHLFQGILPQPASGSSCFCPCLTLVDCQQRTQNDIHIPLLKSLQ